MDINLESKFFSQQFPILTRENNYFYVHHYCKNMFINDVKKIEDEYNNLNAVNRIYVITKAVVYYKIIYAFESFQLFNNLLDNINKVKNLKKKFIDNINDGGIKEKN